MSVPSVVIGSSTKNLWQPKIGTALQPMRMLFVQHWQHWSHRRNNDTLQVAKLKKETRLPNSKSYTSPISSQSDGQYSILGTQNFDETPLLKLDGNITLVLFKAQEPPQSEDRSIVHYIFMVCTFWWYLYWPSRWDRLRMGRRNSAPTLLAVPPPLMCCTSQQKYILSLRNGCSISMCTWKHLGWDFQNRARDYAVRRIGCDSIPQAEDQKIVMREKIELIIP